MLDSEHPFYLPQLSSTGMYSNLCIDLDEARRPHRNVPVVIVSDTVVDNSTGDENMTKLAV